MADSSEVSIGSGSPESVALDLWRIARGKDAAEQKKLLDLYVECLRATTGKRVIS